MGSLSQQIKNDLPMKFKYLKVILSQLVENFSGCVLLLKISENLVKLQLCKTSHKLSFY
jgi:hypothetical protein